MSWISARSSIIKMLESSFWESGREKRNPQGEGEACGAFGRLTEKGKVMQQRRGFPTEPDPDSAPEQRGFLLVLVPSRLFGVRTLQTVANSVYTQLLQCASPQWVHHRRLSWMGLFTIGWATCWRGKRKCRFGIGPSKSGGPRKATWIIHTFWKDTLVYIIWISHP